MLNFYVVWGELLKTRDKVRPFGVYFLFQLSSFVLTNSTDPYFSFTSASLNTLIPKTNQCYGRLQQDIVICKVFQFSSDSCDLTVIDQFDLHSDSTKLFNKNSWSK